MEKWVYVQAVRELEEVWFRYAFVTAATENDAYSEGHRLDVKGILHGDAPGPAGCRLNDFVICCSTGTDVGSSRESSQAPSET
jgi:hypothetical protein